MYRTGSLPAAVSMAVAIVAWWFLSAAVAREQALLSVQRGEQPNDTGSDGATRFAIEDDTPLGGKALKVDLAAGDSFGVRSAKVTDWKPFVMLEFEAFNPSQEDLNLTLTVRHRRTTSYQTRVDVPFTLKPGKNAVKLGIDEMLNVNGSAPDLGGVQRWYIAAPPERGATLYFGDFVLVGPDLPASAGAGTVAGPPAAYKVTGKIGDLPVDLTVVPMGIAGAGAAANRAVARVRTDAKRLERIRAARMPPITRPVLFCTPEADAILEALEIFPPESPWNQLVDEWPLHPLSDRIIASIGREKPLRYNPDMSFILVPPDQRRVPLVKVGYAGESDPGPYPIPDELPIEGWPAGLAQQAGAAVPKLEDVQRDTIGRGGDRHAIVVDPVNRRLYEFFLMRRTDAGWEAGQASIFDLKTGAPRPDGWTSADAAGLPIFPAVVRYDELRRGVIDHALRVTVRKTRRAYVAPATHYASPHENEEYPRMGERIRLKRDFDTSGFSPEVKTILEAMKRYGMFVADNGIEWAISVAPDPRIPNLHEELRKVRGEAFEVVVAP